MRYESEGHGFSRAARYDFMQWALAPEVSLKMFKRTSAAKAVYRFARYGTAEAVPLTIHARLVLLA